MGQTAETRERDPVAARLFARARRNDPNAMTLVEHLSELRRRLIVAVIAFVIGSSVAAVFYQWMLNLLQHPFCDAEPHHCAFYVTGPLDPLALRIKLAAFGGLLLASPIVLFELWRFVTPGLNRNEKRYVVPFVTISVILFVSGCALAYAVFPHALSFLQRVGGPSLHQILSPNEYLSLILVMMLLFGITFEFPVVLVGLQLARVIRPSQLLHVWRWAVIALTLVAAVFTPSADPFSMLILAGPLIAFYFISIALGKILVR
ncbi:MAG: twin-arginine translocase subunit TatC [Acidimicrobiales bacterium]